MTLSVQNGLRLVSEIYEVNLLACTAETQVLENHRLPIL